MRYLRRAATDRQGRRDGRAGNRRRWGARGYRSLGRREQERRLAKNTASSRRDRRSHPVRTCAVDTRCEAASSCREIEPMPRHRRYTTTVVGARSVPRWYEALDRLVTLGQLSSADFADAQYRATQAAILEQEIAGIDVITGGEMHRRTHNRHSPPNAMLNHFWQKIPAFQGVTHPKPISKHDPNVFHPAATCRGPIAEATDLGLIDEFKTVSGFARKPVKVTMS